tara:strand:- start:1417 stop:3579 length:2163 start_codon:yes stop_codon:yes gene_type:complete
MKLNDSCHTSNQIMAIHATRLDEFGLNVKNELYRKALARDSQTDSISGIGLDLVINGMLSGMGTPTVNVLSMMIQSLLKPTIESIGLITDSIKLTKGGREWNQVSAMWQASVDGFLQDGVYFREGFRKGYSLERDITERQLGMTKKDFRTFLKEDMGIEDPKTLNIEQAQDILLDMQDYMHNTIGNTKFGKMFNGKGETLVRWPTKIIVGIDEYGKARFRRQSMFQMASKFAKEDAGHGLGSYDELYIKYKKDLFTDAATSLMWDKRIKTFVAERRLGQENAGIKVGEPEDVLKEARLAMSLTRDDALYNAFQQRLAGTPRKIQQLRHDHPAFALFVPFIKTPWNIIKEGYNYIPIIPTIRASLTTKEGVKKVLFDLRANKVPLHGPVEKMSYDELIPRQIIGMTMFATIGTMFDTDTITGSIPRSPSERQRWKDAGIKPYAIKIGDTWVGYHRFEPVATPLAMAADLLTFTKEYVDDDDINTEEAWELIANLTYMVKSNITSKTFLEGIHTLTAAIVDPNVSAQRGIFETMARPLTPAILAQTAKMMDSYDRQTTGVLERLQSRIPIYREQLPKKFGVYGEAQKLDFSTALTSVPIFDASNMTPVQQEMMRVEWNKGGIQGNFKGVTLSSEQLGELRQLNAELLTPHLETTIASPAYQASSDGMKRKRLDKLSRKTRKLIGTRFANELRKTDPEFAKKFLSAYYTRLGLEDEMPDSLKD